MENDCGIVFVGAGGHARSILEAMTDTSNVLGYIDLKDCGGLRRKDGTVLERIGDDAHDHLPDCAKNNRLIISLVAGATCSLDLRKRVIEKYKGCKFATVVAPTAYVADDVTIDEGSTIMHHVFINCGSVVGKHAVLNTSAVIEHDCRMGDNVFVGPGAVLCGGVTVGNNVFIGANATLKPCINICDDVVIGLGAAVLDDITEPGTYVGIPAKKIS